MRRAMSAILTVAALSAMVACSGGGESGEPAPRDRRTDQETPRAEDTIDLVGDPKAEPPLAFEQEATHTIPMGSIEHPPVTFFGKAAWLVDEAGMTVLDLRTGKEIARIEPENPALYEATAFEDMSKKDDGVSYLTPPQVARIGDELAVLATIPVELESEDGESTRKGVEVIAVRAKDGEVMWRLPVQLYGNLEGQLDASVWRPPYRGMAAVQWSSGATQGTFVVDLNERRMLWQRTDFWVTDGYEDTLVGFTSSASSASVVGVSLDSGVEKWTKTFSGASSWSTGSRPDVARGGGPWTIVEVDEGNGRLMEISTGATAFTGKDGLRVSGKGKMACEMGEGGSVLLCASDRKGALALDAGTEKALWKRPPGKGAKAWNGTVSAIYQDRAYVERGDKLAVVNARTGKTVRAGADTRVVPDWVTPYAGLVRTDKGIEVHLSQR